MFWQDLRYGLRLLLKRPGFTVVAVIALALGIGANTAIFSVVNSILLRPLAYPSPEQLVLINHDYPKIKLKASVSAPGYKHYRDNAKSFASIAALTGGNFNLTDSGEPERVNGGVISQNFFSTLGATAAQGRLFTPEEDRPGRNKVVVLNYAFWQRRYAGNPGILNQSITMNGESYTVVGIMPASFEFGREFGRPMDLWTPIAFTPEQLNFNRLTNEYLTVIGRLNPGTTITQAQAELDTIATNLRTQYMQGADRTNWGLTTQAFSEMVVGDMRQPLLVLLAAVGLVLLIACANVANLLLARAADRQKEITIRSALGANRWRVIRQLLTESIVLSLVGGMLGLALAAIGVRVLVKLNEAQIPRANEIGLDWRVLTFTLGVSLLTGILFGLVPALQISKTNLAETLKEGGRSGSNIARGWVRGTLVVMEMALALMLLIGAGLLIRSFWQLQKVNPGFDPQNLLTMNISLPQNKYKEAPQRAQFYQQALQQIRALPGVEAAGAVSILPMSGNNSSGSFSIEGRQVPQNQSMPHGDRWAATTNYFSTMKIPLIRGRYFEERDTAEVTGVAIIDETMARKYWPDEDPLGKRIAFERDDQGNPKWREIVGIVGHAKHRNLEGDSRVQYYLPHAQMPQGSMFLTIRVKGEPTTVTGAVRGVIHSLDKDLPIFRVTVMEQLVADSMAQRRFAMTLLVIFAGVALVLAAVGLYGVMSYTVTQRSHEIGIRMALGAQRSDVVKMVVRQGMMLASIGVLGGLAFAFALTRLMANLLFGVKASDPITFAVIAASLALIALIACFIPARRATKVDPMIALRYE
ncbi:MAG: ABC transporter permease [Acidobacteria bacterium]|nr:ABC transporter permease [Acidobacteriota bacterium]